MADIIVIDHAYSKDTESLIAELWAGRTKPRVITTFPQPDPLLYRERLRALRVASNAPALLDFLAHPVPLAPDDRIALFGFNICGCIGLLELLSDEGVVDRVDFVCALDGLRGKAHEGVILHRKAWVQLAQRAVEGKVCLVVTYSRIDGFGPPSTRDSAISLVEKFAPWESETQGRWLGPMPGGLHVQECSEIGDFHTWGCWPEHSSGEDGSAHFHHILAVQSAVWREMLAPRWLGSGDRADAAE